MRQFMIWLCLSAKRLGKRPVYWGILLLMPAVTFALAQSQKEASTGIRALVCVTGDGREDKYTDETLARIFSTLQEAEGAVRFEVAENEEELRRAVLTQEAECGYVFPEDFGALLQDGEWKRSVRLYYGREEALPMLVNELVYTAVFREYSENLFLEYSGNTFEKEAGGHKQAEEEADELLNLYLTNGSTFSFTYYGDLPDVDELDSTAEEEVPMTVQIVPVRGMLALFVMLSAFCGLIDYKRDREAGRFVWLHRYKRAAVQWLMVLLPASGAAAVSLFCMGATGNLQGAGKEAGSIILYILLLSVYVMVWGLVFRSEHGVVATMPFLMIASVLFCPVFWNLKAVLPVFAVMEKLFPVSWYLAM